MKLQEVSFERRGESWKSDRILSDKPLGAPFAVFQHSARILVAESGTDEFWRVTRSFNDGSRGFVWDDSYGCGIPNRYFILVEE